MHTVKNFFWKKESWTKKTNVGRGVFVLLVVPPELHGMSYSVKNFLLEKRELDKENQCRAVCFCIARSAP